MAESEFVIPTRIKLLKWLSQKLGAEPTTIQVLPPAQWESASKGKYLLYLSFHSDVEPKRRLIKTTDIQGR